MTEGDYALARARGRTYVSRSFPLRFGHSDERGYPSRYVYRILYEDSAGTGQGCEPNCECEEFVLYVSPKERVQVRAHVVRDVGRVRKVRFQRVRNLKNGPAIEDILELNEDASHELIECLQKLVNVDPNEGEGFRLDDGLLRAVLSDPEAIAAVYARGGSELLRSIVESDIEAEDVIALAARRDSANAFRRMLDDTEYFDGLSEAAGGKELAWQSFFQQHEWILSVGLGSQLLTCWSDQRLEQVVAGFNVSQSGKRTDALLRTAGLVRAMAFAEIKHHRTPLMGAQYRPGCWAASADLSGAIVQTQQTVFQAVKDLGERLASLDNEGAETEDVTYLIRPRSFLVAGSLGEFRSQGGSGGVIAPKFRSFELLRRNLYEPEIITYDELCARAEWHVAALETVAAARDF